MKVYIRVAQLVGAPAGKTKRKTAIPARIPIHRNTLRRWVAEGRFPAPCKLGPGVTAWRLDDVERWEEAQKKEATQ